MSTLHSIGIVHCDVKPDNIFISDDGTAYVGDFDVSKDLRQRSTMAHTLGKTVREGYTIDYAAPEIVKLKQCSTTASDVYSYGVMLEELMNDWIPDGHDDKSSLQALIDVTKHDDPSLRLRMSDVLQHPFFTTSVSRDNERIAHEQQEVIRHRQQVTEQEGKLRQELDQLQLDQTDVSGFRKELEDQLAVLENDKQNLSKQQGTLDAHQSQLEKEKLMLDRSLIPVLPPPYWTLTSLDKQSVKLYTTPYAISTIITNMIDSTIMLPRIFCKKIIQINFY